MATIYGIGRNHAAHAREMGAGAPSGTEPIVFLKPEGARVAPGEVIRLPAQAEAIHHEAELVVKVGPGAVAEAVALGLDLTDRPRQARASAAGLPWARAKGFRGSAPIGPFVHVAQVPALDGLVFTLRVNGAERQRGETRLLLHPVGALLRHLDEVYGLRPGDLVFTGTPEGVAQIRPGDVLELDLQGVPGAASRWRVEGS